MFIAIGYILEVFVQDINIYALRFTNLIMFRLIGSLLVILKIYLSILYYRDFEELTYREIKVISRKIDGL